MVGTALLLGVDGGGTGCRARLVDLEGQILGEGTAGPANMRFGMDGQLCGGVAGDRRSCLGQAGLTLEEADIVACLALAGASEPTHLAAARAYRFPSAARSSPPTRMPPASARTAARTAASSSSAPAASAGASSAAANIASAAGASRSPTKAAAPGSAARRRAECCGRTTAAWRWSGLLKKVIERFDGDPHAIVRWMGDGPSARLCVVGAARSGVCYARRCGGAPADACGRRPHRRDRCALGGAGRCEVGAGGRNLQQHRAVARTVDAASIWSRRRAMR